MLKPLQDGSVEKAHYYGVALVMSGRHAEGVEAIQSVIEEARKYKHRADALYAMAYGLLALGRPGEAKEPLTECGRLYKKDKKRALDRAKALNRLCEAYLRADQDVGKCAELCDEARVILEDHKEVTSVHVRHQFVKAQLAQARREHAAAAAEAARALEMAKGMPMNDGVLIAEVEAFVSARRTWTIPVGVTSAIAFLATAGFAAAVAL